MISLHLKPLFILYGLGCSTNISVNTSDRQMNEWYESMDYSLIRVSTLHSIPSTEIQMAFEMLMGFPLVFSSLFRRTFFTHALQNYSIIGQMFFTEKK